MSPALTSTGAAAHHPVEVLGGDVGVRLELCDVQAHRGAVEQVERHLLDRVGGGVGSRWENESTCVGAVATLSQ
jgi:hypothetical protein